MQDCMMKDVFGLRKTRTAFLEYDSTKLEFLGDTIVIQFVLSVILYPS